MLMLPHLLLCALMGPAFAATAPSPPAMPGSRLDVRWDVPCEEQLLPDAQPARLLPESEKLSYMVQWGVLGAGQGAMAILGLEEVDGRPAYHLKMVLRSTGLASLVHRFEDSTDSWLDLRSLTTVRFDKRTREKGFERDETDVLDQACRRYYRFEARLDKGSSTVQQGRLPGPTHDLLGYIYALRTLPLEAGARFELTLFSGGKVRPAAFVVSGRESISVPAGGFRCLHIEPDLSRAGGEVERVEVWLSDDERRLPVRLRLKAAVGSFTVELEKIGG